MCCASCESCSAVQMPRPNVVFPSSHEVTIVVAFAPSQPNSFLCLTHPQTTIMPCHAMPRRAVHHENRPPNQPKQNSPAHPSPSTYHYHRMHALLPLPPRHPSDPPACLLSLSTRHPNHTFTRPRTHPPAQPAVRRQRNPPASSPSPQTAIAIVLSLFSFSFFSLPALLSPPSQPSLPPPHHHIASCVLHRATCVVSCRVVSCRRLSLCRLYLPACLPISFLSFAVARFVSLRLDSLLAQPFFLSFFFSRLDASVVIPHRFVRGRLVGRLVCR
ncbi:hypothetical protein IWX50DRAFT_31261 [Phyllosticta citricarpa]